jgi:transcriptional regulator with GAF, ATPase, and Fis domain
MDGTELSMIEQDPRYIKKRLSELSTLAEMNEEIHATMNMDALLQVLVEKGRSVVMHSAGLGKNYGGHVPLPFKKAALKNILEASEPLLISDLTKYVTASAMKKHLVDREIQSALIVPLRGAIVDFKKQKVQQALARSGGKKSEAAVLLGMPRSNFSRLLKQLHLR